MIIVLHYQIIQNQTEVLVLKLIKKENRHQKIPTLQKFPIKKKKCLGNGLTKTNKNKQRLL